jgi:hypothetical protein
MMAGTKNIDKQTKNASESAATDLAPHRRRPFEARARHDLLKKTNGGLRDPSVPPLLWGRSIC